MSGSAGGPHVVVLSSLFPSSVQPGSGLFVRERAFRLGSRLPLVAVSPTPWFPFQSFLRRFRPHFRPGAPRHELQGGFDVWYPRFFSAPSLFKHWDGFAMALGVYSRFAALKRAGRLDVIDAHFGYPDGFAAVKLGQWLNVPVTITLRGTEQRHARDPRLRRHLHYALEHASRIFAVSDSLKGVATDLGIPAEKIEVVGNGVDTQRFQPTDRDSARRALGLDNAGPVLISVGGLVERKGFHRVLDVLPELLKRWPSLIYLIVGGASPEGDERIALEAQVDRLGLRSSVRFLGSLPPDQLTVPLSASNVFVLATRNEGWANVFLEAMACGIPVVTTDVGGNRQVVNSPDLGIVVPFGNSGALCHALVQALEAQWRPLRIREYAQANSWSERIERLHRAFSSLVA